MNPECSQAGCRDTEAPRALETPTARQADLAVIDPTLALGMTAATLLYHPPRESLRHAVDRAVSILSLITPLALISLGSCRTPAPGGIDLTVPAATEAPPLVREYVAQRVAGLLVLDGSVGDDAWRDAEWTAPFVDIEGDHRPGPRWATRVKMLWDDTYWYIGAELQEPDIWATITDRDAVIFQDNDFEVFADPDGDTHRYFELEVNALGTPWDLFLAKPYRDGGHGENGWNIEGLKVAVAMDGTLNDPSDRDRAWSVEIAIPWAAFADSGRTPLPVRPGDRWRVNFSRVQWDLVVENGQYRKRTDSTTGKPLAEHNWVWSPQGAVNMHRPEMWGVVRFEDVPALPTPHLTADDSLRWALRRVYYAQQVYRRSHGSYAPDLKTLAVGRLPQRLRFERRTDGYEASVPRADGGGVWRITADGRLWSGTR